MTKNQIIEALFNGKNFNDCIGKMEPEHLREDLKMEVALIVCEWPDEKVIGLHERKELEFFVVRVILNQIQSDSSPFYKKYRRVQVEFADHHIGKPALHIAEDEIEERQQREETEDRALRGIDELYWYNVELINLYKKHGNYRAIEKETGIPFISCYKTIQKSFKELKLKVLQ